MIQDEHEMLIEYSEMTTFNFNSKEFKAVQKDYRECKRTIANVIDVISNLLRKITLAKSF